MANHSQGTQLLGDGGKWSFVMYYYSVLVTHIQHRCDRAELWTLGVWHQWFLTGTFMWVLKKWLLFRCQCILFHTHTGFNSLIWIYSDLRIAYKCVCKRVCICFEILVLKHILIPISIPVKGRLYVFISLVDVFSSSPLNHNSKNIDYKCIVLNLRERAQY